MIYNHDFFNLKKKSNNWLKFCDDPINEKGNYTFSFCFMISQICLEGKEGYIVWRFKKIL
jgi:hypothetical protein